MSLCPLSDEFCDLPVALDDDVSDIGGDFPCEGEEPVGVFAEAACDFDDDGLGGGREDAPFDFGEIGGLDLEMAGELAQANATGFTDVADVGTEVHLCNTLYTSATVNAIVMGLPPTLSCWRLLP